MSKNPSLKTVAFAVGKVTFTEMIRDKILYNLFLFSILLLGLAFLVSQLSFIRPERIVLDFGISAIGLACSMIAVFGGAGLLTKEFERRTASVALSHPITKSQFLLGKFSGLVSVIGLNWLLLFLAHTVIIYLTTQSMSVFSNSTYFLSLILVFVQSILIASLALFFSTFSTTSLAIIFSIGSYLIGNNISQIQFLMTKIQSQFGLYFLRGVMILFPNLEYFNISQQASYALPVSGSFLAVSFTYGLFYTLLVLVFAGMMIKIKEV